MTDFYEQFNVRSRIREVFIGTEVILIIAAIGNYFVEDTILIPLILLATALLNIIPFRVLKKDNIELAGGFYLTFTVLGVSGMIWLNEGIRDSAIFAYPALITYAAILGTQRQFIGATIVMTGSIFMLGVVNLTGIMTHATGNLGWADPINMALILFILSFGLRFVLNDLKDLTSKLTHQVEEVKSSRREIQHMAHHDPLTHLPNRVLAQDRFNHAISQVQRKNINIAILFLDLDRFKPVNDTLGHEIGDLLLVQVAERISGILRSQDSICRFGGDEFIIILELEDPSVHITAVAEKVLASLSREFMVAEHSISISGSIGIATAPNDGMDFNELCKKADMAMYKAKDQGRNAIAYFDPTMDELAEERFKLRGRIAEALDNEQFQVYFQPKVRLADNRVIGAEALIRWPQPDGSFVPPALFIPIAEETAQIIDIGHFVLETACAQCADWYSRGMKDFSVAVNLSVVQFRDKTLVDFITRVLKKYNLNPASLELEITEGLLLDSNYDIKAQIEQLQELGVQFSVDDFGTGYSNLGYLQNFNMNQLKIDQSFIQALTSNEQQFAIVKAIIQLAQSLSLETVAEGVENEAILCILKELNCQVAQGYYWSPAIPSDDFINYVANFDSDLHNIDITKMT